MALNKLLFILLISFSAHGQVNVDSLKRVINHSDHQPDRLSALSTLADYMMFKDSETATSYAIEGRELAVELENTTLQAATDNTLGIILANQGKLDTALFYFKESYELRQSFGENAALSNVVNNIGLVYEMQGKYEESLEYLLKALEIDKKLKNDRGIARSYHNIGNMYQQLNDLENQLKYIKQAIQLNSKLKNNLWLANNYVSMSEIMIDRSMTDSAYFYLHQADSLHALEENNQGSGIVCNRLAEQYYLEGRMDEAISYAKKAINYLSEFQDYRNAASSNIILGRVYLEQGKIDSAIYMIELGYDIVKSGEESAYILDGLNALADAHARAGNMDKAYSYLKEFIRVKDSVSDLEITQSMADLATQYKVKEMDQEIALQQQQRENAELNEKKAQAESDRKSFMIIGLGGVVLLVLILVGIVIKRNREKHRTNLALQEKNEEIELQKEIIEEKNSDIVDSINYAQRIQKALLKSGDLLTEQFEDAFILYLPKDIVSGDFYWMKNTKSGFLLSVIDCTGHGVPGAMMSLLGNSGLNQAVNEFSLEDPGKILDQLSDTITTSLSSGNENVRDGMDMALCKFSGKKMHYAGANNPVWIARDKEMIVLSPDKQPIGEYEDRRPFETKTISLEKGDIVYLFSDGYADQFGGPKGKKMKTKPFQELIMSIQGESMEDQRDRLHKAFQEWRGEYEQLDDVCVIGVRI